MLGVSREDAGRIQRAFREDSEHSGKIKGISREDTGSLQGGYRAHLRRVRNHSRRVREASSDMWSIQKGHKERQGIQGASREDIGSIKV